MVSICDDCPMAPECEMRDPYYATCPMNDETPPDIPCEKQDSEEEE